MKKDLTIGEAELEIMKILWREDKPLNTQFINKAVESKGWKRTTISTFLTRLSQKGAVSGVKEGNTFYYEALISEKEYKQSMTKNLITNLFSGSVSSFAASLFEDESLSQSDIEELKSLILSKEEK